MKKVKSDPGRFAVVRTAEKMAIAAAAVGAVFAAELYRFVFCKNGGLFALWPEKRSHEDEYYRRRDSSAAALRLEKCERYSIVSARGVRLEGFYYSCAEKPSGKIAFIVHGYRSEHAETAGPYYEYYRKKGFDLFCCDHGGAGQSGGQLIGYDVFESADCLQWLGFLQQQFGKDIQVLLHGFSMGGATVLKMSDRCPRCVKFIVSDSGYSSIWEVFKNKAGILRYLLSAINRLAAGYSLHDTDVRGNLLRTNIPILFVHGTKDRTVPFEMGKELYELCPSEKDCFFVEGARHVESIHADEAGYMAKLDKFIENYIT